MTHTSKLCASGENGRRSGLKIPSAYLFAGLRSCSPPFISAFFQRNEVVDSFATVRGVRPSSPDLALNGHCSTTVRAVAVGLVMAEVQRFFAQLKRRVGGCLDIGDGVDLDQARRFALELTGPVDGHPKACPRSSRCVRPAHLEVRS